MRKLIVCLGLALSSTALAQTPPPAPAAPPAKMTVAQIMDRQLTNLENDFVPLVEAMPEGKFTFAPTKGEFKGVRTFAQEVKHVAHTNTMIFSMILGEKLPANTDPKEDDGSAKMTAKADIVQYLKDSFAMGHRAMAGVTEANLTEGLKGPDGQPAGTRLGAASLTIWHSFDHYGQMVEYMRMNGIVPPASRPQK